MTNEDIAVAKASIEKAKAKILQLGAQISKIASEELHPNITVIIDTGRVEILEGIAVEKQEHYEK